MSAANANAVLKLLMDKREQFRGRSVCIGQDMIAQALGTPINIVQQHLEQLAEAGKVHRVSPGCWALGSGRMGKW